MSAPRRWQAALIFAMIAALLALRGCGGSKQCASDNDCGSGDNCSFTAGDCSGQGVCATWDNQCDGPPTQVCTCDGKNIYVACGYPGQPEPTRSTGICPIPSGTPCNGPNDCDPEALCAFPVADGCNAKGTCVLPDHTCTNDRPLACGCDGNLVGGSCIYGPGNVAAPIRSPGLCPGLDAGTDSGGDSAVNADGSAESGAD